MKNSNENNEELQLVLDSIVQALSDIKEEITVIKNRDSDSLNTDLLNKIIQTIDESKKGITAKELQAYSVAVIGTARQLQDEANVVFTQFLNEKILQLEQITKQPSVVKNHYEIDFKSSKMFVVVIILCLGIGVSLYFNYNQSQENNRLKHNDIKYRYVQMKGGVSYDDIINLNRSYMTRSYYRDSIENKIVEFENLVRQKAYNESVKEQNEKDNKQIDKKLKELTK